MILKELVNEHRELDKLIVEYEKMNKIAYHSSTIYHKIKELKKKKLLLKDRIEYYRNISV